MAKTRKIFLGLLLLSLTLAMPLFAIHMNNQSKRDFAKKIQRIARLSVAEKKILIDYRQNHAEYQKQKKNLMEIVSSEDVLFLVLKSSHCGPCKFLDKRLKKAIIEGYKFRYLPVDVEEGEFNKLGRLFILQSIIPFDYGVPYLFVYKKGVLEDTFIGYSGYYDITSNHPGADEMGFNDYKRVSQKFEDILKKYAIKNPALPR